MPAPLDDGRLVESHRDGDAAAFDVIFRRYYPRLVRLCRRRGAHTAQAEDLAQETLTRALANIDRFDTSLPMWPWLKIIAINLQTDEARRLPAPEDRSAGAEAADDLARWTVEERPVLERAMAALSSSQRVALRLRYLEDWTHQEAAAFLRLGPEAFRQLLARARRRLRTEYERLTRGALGLLSAPLGWLRRAADRSADAVTRRVGPAGAQMSVLSPDPWHQMVTGMVALLLLAGPVVDVAPTRPAEPSAVAAAIVAGNVPPHRPQGTSRRPDVPPAEAPSGGIPPSGPEPEPGRSVDRDTKRIVDEITDGNRDVRQPEDAVITSIETSPDGDGPVYAVGSTDCRGRLCPTVLFRSADGGGSWRRLPARGLQGDTLLLPPGGDPRIFAMGPLGLQVSDDGGKTFRTAARGAASVIGPAAISPGWADGDRTILIGGQALFRYRDDLETIEPAAMVTTVTGPFYPAFAPDGAVLLGGLAVDPTQARQVPVVLRCDDGVCGSVTLPTETDLPRLFVSAQGSVVASTVSSLLVSRDGGRSFERLRLRWSSGWISDVLLSGGSLSVGVGPDASSRGGGLFTSSNAGRSWDSDGSGRFAGGVRSLGTQGDRTVVGLTAGGVACSADGGRTWASRCPP